MAYYRFAAFFSAIFALSGCYFGAPEPLVASSENLSVLPTRTEGYTENDDGEIERVVIYKPRADGPYRVSLPDDPGLKPFDLVVFDTGSESIYGAQAVMEGRAFYALIRPRMEETIQIDLIRLDLTQDELDELDVAYSGSVKAGIDLGSRDALDRILRYAIETRSYDEGGTIRTEPGGFRARPDAVSDFNPDGFAAGNLLAAIYAGRTGSANAYRYSPYLLEFATVLNQVDGDPPCLRLFTQRVRTQLPIMATARGLAIIAGDIYDTHKNASGNLDRTFTEGVVGGAKSFAALAAITMAARGDAAIFYRRYGCDGSRSNRFFDNFNAFVAAGAR